MVGVNVRVCLVERLAINVVVGVVVIVIHMKNMVCVTVHVSLVTDISDI